MQTTSFAGWIHKLSVRNKLTLTIGIMIVFLFLGLIELSFSMKIMSSIRAYVGGEGLWSKAQKQAVIQLIGYTQNSDQTNYDSFIRMLQVTQGDKIARLELDKPHPNYDLVYQGFIAGNNDPSDIKDMIFLYRYFRHNKYMSKAIDIWSQGDIMIEELISVGQKIRNAKPGAELDSLVLQVYEIDKQLTILENRFSSTLSEASRYIRTILFQLAIVITFIFGGGALLVELYLRKILIQIDATKTEFVSLASHQLRTPLGIVKWYLEVMQKEPYLKQAPKNIHKYLSQLIGSNERVLSLVGELLSVSRIDQGRVLNNPKLTDINQLIKATINEIHPLANSKQISLKFTTLSDTLPPVYIDPLRLHEVLENLLTNATEYTPSSGSIAVSVNQDREWVEITIKDTGIGISTDDQKKLFTKFFRSQAAIKQNPSGTGLGLFLVKSYVEGWGGNISITSQPNLGTTVKLRIPTTPIS